MSENMELIENYPAKVSAMLLNNEIDVGLVPVAIIPKLKEYHIITDYCIGAEGPVASVCLFSNVPIGKIEKVLLDYQSQTSIELAKLLFKNYWKITPHLEDTKEDFCDEISGTTAGIVIGDRAFEQRKRSPYIYDLAEAWISMTSMPFVFAAWIANKKLPKNFIVSFNEANKIGLNNIDKVVAENQCQEYDLKTYFSENISYELTSKKLHGLQKFLELIANLKEEKMVLVKR
jgi:chorismate dehydratase